MGIGTALYNGLSGLNSFSTAMSVVSDNVANADTTGFKSASVRFGDMVNTYLALQSNSVQSQGAGSAILGIGMDHTQGNLRSTSYWSDLAMSGEGFFIVQDYNNGTLDTIQNYTRDGSFHLDKTGNLVNQQGWHAMGYKYDATTGTYDTTLTEINIASPEQYKSMRVDTDGTVHVVDPSAASPDQIAYKMGLAAFSNKNGLVRQGGNLYIAGPEIGTISYNGGASPAPNLFGDVNDYSLEGSNVDLAKEMVNMIVYQADYNANSKTISTSSNMLDTSIGLVR